MSENIIEEVYINGLDVSSITTDIMSSGVNRSVITSFIRGKGSEVSMGKYGETGLSMVFQINLTEISEDAGTPENPHDYVKLLCQLDNYPFCFIKSLYVDKFISTTARTSNGSLMFAIRSFEASMNIASEGVITVALILQYFNHNPLCSDLEYYSVTRVPLLTERSKSKVLGKEVVDDYRINDTDDLMESGFTRYFLSDYRRASKLLTERMASNKMDYVEINTPVFSRDEPEEKEGSKEMIVSRIGESGGIEKLKIYVSWPYRNGINRLNADDSRLELIRITKTNNFASHAMASKKYPVLQYMGKGTNRVEISVTGAADCGALEIIKHNIRALDVNKTRNPKYSQYNVLKLNCLLTDIVPIFGMVGEREASNSQSNARGSVSSSFVFIEKNCNEIVEEKNTEYTQSANENNGLDVERMVKTLEKLSKDKTLQDDNFLTYVGTKGKSTIDKDNVPAYRKMAMPKGLSLDYLFVQNLSSGMEESTLYNVMYQESRGKADAYNKYSGAKGAFQFMPATAEQYGLKDRSDPKESAKAASKYLKVLKKEFKTDELALAAYNWGPGNVRRMMRRRGKNSWEGIRDFAPKETRGYVRDIRAAVRIDNNTKQFSQGKRPKFRNLRGPLINKEKLRRDIAELRGDPGSLRSEKAKLRIEEAYMDLLIGSYKEDDVMSAYLATDRAYLEKNILTISNFLKGEAYSDMDLGGRLMSTVPLSDDEGNVIEDARKIRPFFFMKSKPYISPEIAKRSFRKISRGLEGVKDKIVDLIEDRMLEGSEGTDFKTLKTDRHSGESYTDMKKVLTELEVGQTFGRLTGSMDSGTIENLSDLTDEDIEVTDILNENAQATSQCEREGGHFGAGINLAFPVVKVYMIIGDENLLLQKIRGTSSTFYELEGITNVTLSCQNDESPVDMLLITLANSGSIYSDTTVAMDRLYFRKDWSAAGTSHENRMPTDRLIIRPGTRIQVRAGYTNDPNELEVMFNGVASEVSGVTILNIVCEGFGRELVSVEHGSDPSEDVMTTSADTEEVVATMLYCTEISHFGESRWFGKDDPEGEGRRPFLFSSPIAYLGSANLFRNTYFDNVFSSSGENYGWSLWASLPFSDRSMSYHFPIYKTTPWQTFKEMEYRHPGAYVKAALYGDRASLFFGVKEQLYVYRSLAKEVQRNSDAYALYDKVKSARYKPICDFHVASSDLNIIYNGLTVGSDFNTRVAVRYYDDESAFKSNDFEYTEIDLDDNLLPSALRSGRCEMPGIHGPLSSFAYGSTYLRKEVEKMYGGSLIILGHENVKSGDYISINDSSRGMSGIIKVRECIHSWDVNNGYVTEITPGLFAESSHSSYSILFPKLHMAYLPITEAVRQLSVSNGTGNQRFVDLALLSALASLGNDLTKNVKGGKLNILNNFILNGHTYNIVGSYAAILAGPAWIGYSLVKGIPGTAAALRSTSALWASAASVTKGLQGAKLFVGAKGAQSAASVLSFSGRAIGTLGGPLGVIASSMVIGALSSSIREYTLTRQPVRIYPVSVDYKPYIGGIYGFNDGSAPMDVWRNITKNWDELEYIWTAITG